MTNYSILKNLPWSEENTKWAQSRAIDPAYSSDAINERIKKIREILKRPDPGSNPSKATLDGTNLNPNPLLEEDVTDQQLSEKDQTSLGDIQGDLRSWWSEGEEAAFYERLAKFKAKMGDKFIDRDIYDLWIEEWARKVKEVSK